MKKTRILFFDIDGTLVDPSSHIVPQSTKTALQTLHAAGHTLCISTGRSMNSVRDGGFCDLIPWDCFLCNNGQAVYDKKQRLLHLEAIDANSVKACMDIAKQQGVPLYLMGEDEMLTMEANEDVIVSSAFFKEAIPPVKTYNGFDVVMMIAYAPMGDDYAAYRKVEGIEVIPGQSSYADVVRKGFNKAIGIQFVLKHFGFQEYIAIGDSLNDMEMIQDAAIGIAMGNAHEDLKQVADIVCPPVDHDGVYEAMKQIHLV